MDKNRKLYKIGHLANLLGITHRTIRYYDQLGLLPHMKRSDGGIRLFDDEDITIIKKIRHMQRKEYLPLDIIKDRLFAKKRNPKNVYGIVTDSTAVLDATISKKHFLATLLCPVEVQEKRIGESKAITSKELWKRAGKSVDCPKLVAPSQEAFVEAYLDLHKKGFKKVFSIHTSSTCSNIIEEAKKAALKVDHSIEVVVIDSKSIGAGLGLFVERIAEAIDQSETLERIELLIKKQMPLIFQAGTIPNTSYLLLGHQKPKESLTQTQLLNSLLTFVPVFTMKDGSGEIHIETCRQSNEEALEILKETVMEEFEARGKYVNRIRVCYLYHFSLAEKLLNELKALLPNTPVTIDELSSTASIEFGPECIIVSMI